MFERNRLWIDRKNRIIGTLGGVRDYYVGIRPANANAARPGDDLLLTFGVRKRGEAEAITFTTMNAADEVQRYYALATMQDVDYVAVYDKKMVWRANLYIDDNSPEDWNNRHPWVTNNAWNRDDGGSVADGKQTISIKPFTYHMIRYNQDYKVSRNVGYFNWGYDDPFDFNEKLDSQSRVLSQWYTAGSVKFSQPVLSWGELTSIQSKTLTQLYDITFQSDIWRTIIAGFLSLNDQQKKAKIVSKMGEWIASVGTYKSTLAPGGTPSGVWSNYVGLLFNNGAYQIAGNDFFPYLPKEDDILANRGKLTGADCVGFVWQSASYPDNIYSWARVGEPDMLTWTENMSYRPFGYPTTANSFVIAKSAPYDNSVPPNTNPKIPALKYLTPGDVITFHNFDEDNSNRHFAIILNITLNEDGSVSPSGVQLIESSHRRNPLMTGPSDTNSLQFYEQRRYDIDDAYGTWQVQRLSTRQ